MRARRPPHYFALVLPFIVLGLLSCSEPTSRQHDTASKEIRPPRLVLLYATCSVSKQYLSPYEPSVRFTPHLQRFAEGSLVFQRHRTEAGQSGIAFASIFTGLQAEGHGVYYHPASLEKDLRLLAEPYAEAGYETFYWQGHPVAAANLNYAQGVGDANVVQDRLTANAPRFKTILDRLRTDPDYKALIITPFTVTHSPYSQGALPSFLQRHPDESQGFDHAELTRWARLYKANYLQFLFNFPETVKRLRLSAENVEALARAVDLLYRANIFVLDGLFGDLMDTIEASGLMEESLVAFTADHGEILYRKSALFKWAHGFQLAPEVLDVPLIIHAPGLAPGIYQGVTRSIDVFPTMLGLSGLQSAIPADVGGRDLSDAIHGDEPAPRLTAYSHTSTIPTVVLGTLERWTLLRKFYPRQDEHLIWVSMRDEDMVYKWRNLGGKNWGMEAFDLATDPVEEHDLFDPTDARHLSAKDALLAYKSRLVAAYRDQLEGRRPNPGGVEADRERLRQLGYVK